MDKKLLFAFLNKHLASLGFFISISTLVICAYFYPGGNDLNKTEPGFNVEHNYLCHLFYSYAVNGQQNHLYIVARLGFALLSFSAAFVFIRLAKRIPNRVTRNFLIVNSLLSATILSLIFTNYHDLAGAVASTGYTINLFVIFYLLFRSGKANIYLKLLAVVVFSTVIAINVIYFSGWGISVLAFIQKGLILVCILWLLMCDYFTTTASFEKTSKNENAEISSI